MTRAHSDASAAVETVNSATTNGTMDGRGNGSDNGSSDGSGNGSDNGSSDGPPTNAPTKAMDSSGNVSPTDAPTPCADASDEDVKAALGQYGINTCTDVFNVGACTNADYKAFAEANCPVSCGVCATDNAGGGGMYY